MFESVLNEFINWVIYFVGHKLASTLIVFANIFFYIESLHNICVRFMLNLLTKNPGYFVNQKPAHGK